MTEPDPDILARRTLRNHRMFASGLLVLMAILTIATYLMPTGLVERVCCRPPPRPDLSAALRIGSL